MIRILISYRRADSAAIAGRICDHLSSRYGAASVFMDIDAIPYAADFRDAVQNFLRGADILVAVIGPLWRGERDDGTARILEPDDAVLIEIETALTCNVEIVPVLVGGAKMPRPAELPESIRKLSFLNAATMDSGRDFSIHMARLTGHIDRVLASKGKSKYFALRLSPVQTGLASVLIGVSLLLPFVGTWAQISPPWPRGVAQLTVVTEIAAMVFAFQLLKSSRVTSIHHFWLAASLILGLALTSYLTLVARFTYETPSTQQLWAKGFVCTPEALLVYKERCPDLGFDELRDAEYEADRLWTSRSVTTIKVSLMMFWVVSFIALGFLTGSFVAQQRLLEMERGARRSNL